MLLKPSLIPVVPSGPFLVLLTRERLSVRDVREKTQWEGAASLRLERTPDKHSLITRFGDDAERAPGELVCPFAHDRVIVGDFRAGEKLLQMALLKVWKRTWLSRRPHLVIQVREVLTGGISQIEIRALQEMGFGAGALSVDVCAAGERQLADEEVERGNYCALAT